MTAVLQGRGRGPGGRPPAQMPPPPGSHLGPEPNGREYYVEVEIRTLTKAQRRWRSQRLMRGGRPQAAPLAAVAAPPLVLVNRISEAPRKILGLGAV
jgi:hypothetical protein